MLSNKDISEKPPSFGKYIHVIAFSMRYVGVQHSWFFNTKMQWKQQYLESRLFFCFFFKSMKSIKQTENWLNFVKGRMLFLFVILENNSFWTGWVKYFSQITWWTNINPTIQLYSSANILYLLLLFFFYHQKMNKPLIIIMCLFRTAITPPTLPWICRSCRH